MYMKTVTQLHFQYFSTIQGYSLINKRYHLTAKPLGKLTISRLQIIAFREYISKSIRTNFNQRVLGSFFFFFFFLLHDIIRPLDYLKKCSPLMTSNFLTALHECSTFLMRSSNDALACSTSINSVLIIMACKRHKITNSVNDSARYFFLKL